MTPAYSPDTFHHGVSLRHLNTFGLEATARRYYRATSPGGIREALTAERPTLVLGGGSNLLLTREVDGLVLHVDSRGLIVEDGPANSHEVLVTVAAGESWHGFVMRTLELGLGGLENLSLIPGSVGASPVQNIGAYGVEIKDHFVRLEAIDVETLARRTFTLEDCGFGYRSSVFKTSLRGRYVITSVTFRLTRERHALRADYGDVRAHVEARGLGLSPKHISDAVIAIRRSKLPDPVEIGNSGSFFKNPELPAEQYARFAERHPTAPSYPLPDGGRKVPAGWLIDQAGWKGHRRGAIGVHDRQALVLVNHGGGVGKDLYALAREIQADVRERYGIELEMEVNVW